jgi:hypothetical protein
VKPILAFLLVVFLLHTSCKKSTVDDANYSEGYEYFPLRTGQEHVYDIDCVVYDDFRDTIFTYRYQKRQLVGDTFYDFSNQLQHMIHWYYRPHDSAEWIFYRAGSARLNTYAAEVVENNERVVKLVFPVETGKEWNAYMFSTRTGEPEYYYRSLQQTYSSPAGNFTQVAEVIQEDDSNLIEKRFRSEWYAPLRGLVYKQIDSLETQFNGQGQPETKGYRYYQRLRSFTP